MNVNFQKIHEHFIKSQLFKKVALTKHNSRKNQIPHATFKYISDYYGTDKTNQIQQLTLYTNYMMIRHRNK